MSVYIAFLCFVVLTPVSRWWALVSSLSSLGMWVSSGTTSVFIINAFYFIRAHYWVISTNKVFELSRFRYPFSIWSSKREILKFIWSSRSLLFLKVISLNWQMLSILLLKTWTFFSLYLTFFSCLSYSSKSFRDSKPSSIISSACLAKWLIAYSF